MISNEWRMGRHGHGPCSGMDWSNGGVSRRSMTSDCPRRSVLMAATLKLLLLLLVEEHEVIVGET